MNPTEPSLLAASAELIIARPGEFWLKGKNRGFFERCAAKNLRHALADIPGVRVDRLRAQFNVHCAERAGDATRRMLDVFGLSTIIPAWGAAPTLEAILPVAERVLAEALELRPRDGTVSFRVDTKRADKRFPLTSPELNRRLAEHLLPLHGERLTVDLKHAELTLGVHIRPERAYISGERLHGAGGLPVGSIGRTLCLLSGGIDSPVAAWLTMKRGCDVSFVSFHSFPYIGESSQRKIRRLAEALMRYQRRARLYTVPFARIQEAIRDSAPEPYRTVLYRRMMQRIASRLAEKSRLAALVTGESLGQVASQTLENLTCINAASSLPVLRPLISFDKQETIALARRIGTYDLSVQPEPDCCTVFQPEHPVIYGSVADCERAEAELEVEQLVSEALAGTGSTRLG